MKNNNEEIVRQYQSAKFDSDPKRKARVYTKATAPKRASSFKWAYATGVSFVLFFGFFVGVYSDKIFSSKTQDGIVCSVIETDKQNIILSAQTMSSASTQDLTEEDCAEVNTKYLLAQAASQQSILLAKAKDCPTASEPISSYDSKLIAALEREMTTYSKNMLSTQDMDKLKICTDKYRPKVEPLFLYKVAC
ncbi:hypothetical protein Dip518_001426 [Parelusimicrobium proximum]|uniref:hypothetical protein n=1 Tax=Parelusimicrobium proximum TaxID=3228953 RepID=UPI003D17874A